MSTSLQKIDVCFLTKLCEWLLGGEPVFIVRAQDTLAVDTVLDYQQRAVRNKASNKGRVQTHLDKIVQWQQENPDKVKVPD